MDVLSILSDHKLWIMIVGSLLFPVLLKATEFYLKQRADQTPSVMQILETYRTEVERLTLELARMQQRATEKEQEIEELWTKLRQVREELQLAHFKVVELEMKYGTTSH